MTRRIKIPDSGRGNFVTVCSPTERRQAIYEILERVGRATQSELWEHLKEPYYVVAMPSSRRYALSLESDLLWLEKYGYIHGVTTTGERRKGEYIYWEAVPQ